MTEAVPPSIAAWVAARTGASGLAEFTLIWQLEAQREDLARTMRKMAAPRQVSAAAQLRALARKVEGTSKR